MKAMILAAGLGTRMRELGKETPKALMRVRNKPLIAYHLEALATAGFTNIVINVSVHADKIQSALKDGSSFGVHIQYSEEKKPLGAGGGIHHALPLLGDKPFLVISSDIWTDYPLHQLAHDPNYLAHLVLIDNPIDHPTGDFSLTDHFISTNEPKKFTYGSIGVFHPQLFDNAQPGFSSIMPILQPAIDQKKVTGEQYDGKIININTPEILNEINRS